MILKNNTVKKVILMMLCCSMGIMQGASAPSDRTSASSSSSPAEIKYTVEAYPRSRTIAGLPCGLGRIINWCCGIAPTILNNTDDSILVRFKKLGVKDIGVNGRYARVAYVPFLPEFDCSLIPQMQLQVDEISVSNKAIQNATHLHMHNQDHGTKIPRWNFKEMGEWPVPPNSFRAHDPKSFTFMNGDREAVSIPLRHGWIYRIVKNKK